MAIVMDGNENNFQEEVLDSTLPVLVDFWAPWCGYCTKLTPVFEELAMDMSGKVKFVKIISSAIIKSSLIRLSKN